MEHWDKAQALHLDGKFDEAESLYTLLLEQNHENVGLLATLGSLYLQMGKLGLAIHFLEDGIKRGMKDSDVMTNLAIAYKQSGQIEKAHKYFEDSIKDNPTPEALTNYSGMFIESGQSGKCASLCELAIEGNPELPVAHWNLAISLLGDGIWERAWDEHEWGLKSLKLREDRKLIDVPMWDGPEKSPGKTVLVYGEQGLGDEIMFTSMLPDLLKTNKVIYECHKRLFTLFKKSFPEVHFYGTREDKEIYWAGNHKIDYRLPVGSLGRFYRRSRQAFPGTPYLKAEPFPKGNKFRVGISWMGGGAKLGRVQKRSVPLTWWKSILDLKDVEFVNLQYTDSKDDIDIIEALDYEIKCVDAIVKAKDYYETARLVASCDLIISVCTSLVHLAGALGVPCWVMTPKYPAWRYQNSGGMPWYRSVRLYRSPDVKQDAWIAVIERIAFDLSELLAGNSNVRKIS